MGNIIKIQVQEIEVTATLRDSETAQAIWNALPIEAGVNTWGDEIYFSIPVSASESKDAREIMSVGEIAYWPPGTAFCIFFGRTPASTDDKPRAASNVNPLGRVDGDATVFKQVRSGATIRLEKAL